MATINRGDKIEINGETWYYYGTSEGNDFYTQNPSNSESNCQLYYVSDSGTVEKVYVATAQGLVTESKLGHNGNDLTKVPNTDVKFRWKDLLDTTSTTVDYQNNNGVYIYGTTESEEKVSENIPTLYKDSSITSKTLRNQTLPGRSGTEVMTYKGSANGYEYWSDSIGNIYKRASGTHTWEDCNYNQFDEGKALTISDTNPNDITTTPSTPSVPYADFDYTFSCDSKAINDELKEKINTAADNIESLIELIYGKIHGMSVDGIWSGESYEAFKSNIDGYKKNLDDLVVVLRGFVKLFDDAKTEAENLGTSVDKEINSVS